MVRYILIFSLLFLLSCDDHLASLPSLDYYCPVENLDVSLNDFNRYELIWEYDPYSNENCSGVAFKFLIYSSQDSIFDFSSPMNILSPFPEYDNIPNEYYFDEFDENIYHYITVPFNNIGEENFFTVLVDYGNNNFSYENPITSLALNVGGPNIDLNLLGCDDGSQ